MNLFSICAEQVQKVSSIKKKIKKKNKEGETYTAMMGSTSQGSGTSRFMVRVLDNGILAKKALGPLIE